MPRQIVTALSLVILILILAIPSTALSAVSGLVADTTDASSIPSVTVQLLPSGKTSLTNDDGRFRVIPEPGDSLIRFSHVAYQSRDVKIAGNDIGRVSLTPGLHVIGGIKVYDRSYDLAQRIIVEAIQRKEEILSRIRNYRNDSYLKFVLKDESVEDSSKIFMITESQTTVYWEAPDNYKEILTARKSSANINVENAIIGVGEMLNFNKNRIDVGEYSIVSPVAKDALDYYNYYLLDTLRIDGTTRYLLEVEPKNQLDPLFAGTIQIVDSTYDVVMVDVGFNEGVTLSLVSDMRYRQRMALFDATYWVPVEISFSGLVTFDVALPGIPSKLSFDYLASLYSFEFNRVLPKQTFDEYEFEVAETADDFDSTSWSARQTVPLSQEELDGYARIDSLEQLPDPITKKLALGLVGGIALMSGAADDIFHYNRVEGPYFGFGFTTRKLIPRSRFWAGAGYSDDLGDWQYRVGLRAPLTRWKRLHLSFEVKDKVTHRPSATIRQSYHSTFMALMAQLDPFDYFREEGFRIGFDLRPFNHHQLRANLLSYDQSSLSVNETYSVLDEDKLPRINPEIAEGSLRSLTAGWRYDSRKMVNNKGVESPGFGDQYLTLELDGEYSSSDLFDSDFSFRRLEFSAHLEKSLIGNSRTEFNMTLGISDRSLPSQRFFGVDFGVGVIMAARGFNTLDDSLFVGDRLGTFYVVHDLGNKAFARMHLPLLKKIPFGLMLHGGAFWSSFEPETVTVVGLHRTAITPYSEAGFTLYNLTPFIAPFNFAAGVTWQLSDYDTTDWAFHFGFKL